MLLSFVCTLLAHCHLVWTGTKCDHCALGATLQRACLSEAIRSYPFCKRSDPLPSRTQRLDLSRRWKLSRARLRRRVGPAEGESREEVRRHQHARTHVHIDTRYNAIHTERANESERERHAGLRRTWSARDGVWGRLGAQLGSGSSESSATPYSSLTSS